MSLTKVSYSMINGSPTNVKDFGATSTGTSPTDDINAINSAIAESTANSNVDCNYSRISVTSDKPSFDANVAPLKDVVLKSNVGISYQGPTQENVYFSNGISTPYGTYANGVPVNEQIMMAPYHPGYVVDVKTPETFNNVPQTAQIIGAEIGSTTANATSFVFRKDGDGEAAFSIRDSVPPTASFTASISGTVMTVTAVASGALAVGQQVSTGGTANGVIQGTTIVNQLTGSAGGTGTYTISYTQTALSQSMTSGLVNRRRYDFSYLGGGIGNTYKLASYDLKLGYTSFNAEKTVMTYPFEVGAIINISRSTAVRSDLSSFNTNASLRLEDLVTGFNGTLQTHTSNQYMVLTASTASDDGSTYLQLGPNSGFLKGGGSYTAPNAASSILQLSRSASTSRSINASGTLNASGADYAEYEQNNGLVIAKGAIVGFKADGTLTLTFSEAVRFGVKSTDPSFVGGDTWGSDLTGDALEAARAKVDRIAYSGKVPVNVLGATAGGYIIAVAAQDGSITGEFVADPDFSQYKKAVGRVNKILADGRAEVAVIVH